MALDGKILQRAKRRLDSRREANESQSRLRLEQVYAEAPEVRELDQKIRSDMLRAVELVMSGVGSDDSRVEELRQESAELQRERAETLGRLGHPADYTDDIVMCPKCRDTGYYGTGLCDCLRSLYFEEQKKELSGLLKIGEQTFDSFRLEYYEDSAPEGGTSPRRIMEAVYEYCVMYARRFGENSANLFFTGGTGLGKTFLSSCIAKVVSEKGNSVVYDTAAEVFSRFEADKFARDERAAEDVRRYLECDLLILDDLGTEMTTAFTVSALYTIVNSRLAAGKKTIISTNLSETDLRSRYSGPIASRIEGEYTALRFFGKDIRLMKGGK